MKTKLIFSKSHHQAAKFARNKGFPFDIWDFINNEFDIRGRSNFEVYLVGNYKDREDYVEVAKEIHNCEMMGRCVVFQEAEQEDARYSVGDIIRVKNYKTGNASYRLWKVVGVHLGAFNQEGTYELKPLDIKENKNIQVPCILLETHGGVEKI